jgi:hypothetical protein
MCEEFAISVSAVNIYFYAPDLYPSVSCATKMLFVFCSGITAESVSAVNVYNVVFQYIPMLLL